MASPRRNVLCLAVKTITPDMTIPAPLAKWTPEAVASVFKEQIDRLRIDGIDVTSCYPDDSSMAELREIYYGQHWDGVLIGGGMRTVLELIQLFEDAINVVVAKEQSPPPKIVFTNGPAQVYERVTAGLKP